MPAWDTLLIVLAASVVLNAIPGPSNLYVLSRAVSQGRRAGLISALGLASGAVLHVLMTAAGIAAVLAYSATAFAVVKYLGAGYLIYLGIRTLRDRTPLAAATLPRASHRRLFLQGFLTEVLNPKTALFFLSFLPQFVDPAAGSVGLQIVILGLLVPLTALPLDSMVAAGGGMVARALVRRPLLRRGQQWASGALLIGLGVRVALSERH